MPICKCSTLNLLHKWDPGSRIPHVGSPRISFDRSRLIVHTGTLCILLIYTIDRCIYMHIYIQISIYIIYLDRSISINTTRGTYRLSKNKLVFMRAHCNEDSSSAPWRIRSKDKKNKDLLKKAYRHIA